MINRIIKVICIGFLFSLLSFENDYAQNSFYVSPKGNDANSGKELSPFRSVKEALAKARKTKGKVFIKLLGGTYYLNQPLVFTPADSRKKNEPLVISSAKNQKVIISGGFALTNLHWEKYKNGIWQTKIAQHLVFDELAVNGELQPMARYPNYDASAHFFGGTAADAISKARADRWKSPEGGYVHALHQSEWGDFHYIITGKNEKGEPVLDGGWQNNRRMGMHPEYRFVENIFEELDAEKEWFYDKKDSILYYLPPKELDLAKAKFETPQLPQLIEFRGSEANPIQNIHISGISFTLTTRTFMQTREPLLRSDWTIYRGGAILLTGAANCSIENCNLYNLGGNGIFFSDYNRNCQVSGCKITEIGASAVCFVGNPNAVRSPSFEYNEFVPLAQIDKTPGPKTNNYPADCKVYDNLMFDLGLVEKQSAGVELSMCRRITVSHNSIYDVPRAGINVSEGTWGGHMIEFNDVFNTVKESGDHGSFNSWARDRYWHPNKQLLDSIVAANFNLSLLDVVEPITLRNNRMQCDHGWDIDLDDGSSNYKIYNNLCLNGGLKLREGVNRLVENNIIINNTFHPHVWFKNSHDIFRHNIVMAAYKPIDIKVWGDEVDHNIFGSFGALKEAQQRGTDLHSVAGNPEFINPAKNNYQVKKGSIALAAGFKNFAMDNFGVVSPRLKAVAKTPPTRKFVLVSEPNPTEETQFLGATVKNLTTLGERSATGMNAARGVLVLKVDAKSAAAKFLRPNDVVLVFKGKEINNLKDLLDANSSASEAKNKEIIVFRNQKEVKLKLN